MMIGRVVCAAMSRTISSVNAPAWVEVPISMVGCTWRTTSASPGRAPPTAPVLHLGPGVGVGHLEVVEVLEAVVGDQPVAAQRLEPPGRLLVRQALADHLVAHHVRDAQPGGARRRG